MVLSLWTARMTLAAFATSPLFLRFMKVHRITSITAMYIGVECDIALSPVILSSESINYNGTTLQPADAITVYGISITNQVVISNTDIGLLIQSMNITHAIALQISGSSVSS
jgi:hypothetical protein